MRSESGSGVGSTGGEETKNGCEGSEVLGFFLPKIPWGFSFASTKHLERADFILAKGKKIPP